MKPLVIELFAGLHGWGEGFLAEGYRVVGFDVVDMCAAVGVSRPKGIELVLQDVRTLHGSQFRDAACIVASPPCQAYSYRAMPWKQAKALTLEEVGLPEPAWWKLPEYRKRKDGASPCMSLQDMAEWAIWKRKHPKPPPSNELFDACFRIQREANNCSDCDGTGNFYGHDEDGDFLPCDACNGTGYPGGKERPYIPMVVENVKGAQPWVGSARWHFGSFYLWGDVPALMPITSALKNNGGSWFANGVKVPSVNGRRTDIGKGARFTSRDCGIEGVKQQGLSGDKWFNEGVASRGGCPRKAASAQIAKIPFTLSRHIARCFKHPVEAVA